jgi:hypothetical protein
MGDIVELGKERKKRKRMYVDILCRATVMGLMTPIESTDRMMDIESADRKFNLRLDEWYAASDFNFAHDFYGIIDNINRESGFPATDFGLFIPRFAGGEFMGGNRLMDKI